jgi:hypothetical protein
MPKKTLHPTVADFQLKKKQKRNKEKEEGRKLRPTMQSRPTASLDLASHRDPRLGLANVFLWFFLLVGLVFSLVFRMIKSKKWLTFPSRF